MPTPRYKQHPHKASRLPQLLVLSGFAILVIAFLAIKSLKKDSQTVPFTPDPNQLAEVQLDQALEANLPVLAFFHSNNCEKCLIMMETVSQVYPEYQDQVVLVDVDVYNDFNRSLLRRVRVQYIPTLVFYDPSGDSKTQVGVMEAEQLRQTLAALAEGD